jgi:hypothetical protein
MKLKNLLRLWPQVMMGLLFALSVLVGVWTLCHTYGLEVHSWTALVIGTVATWLISLVITGLNLYLKVR